MTFFVLQFRFCVSVCCCSLRRGSILGQVLQFTWPQWGVLGVILILPAVLYSFSFSGVPGSFALTKCVPMVFAFRKATIGGAWNVVLSSVESVITLQCFLSVSFILLVAFENTV